MNTYTWTAVSRSGTAQGGSMVLDPADLATVVQGMYDRGVRWATIRTAGRIAGAVERARRGSGRRIWWAENTPEGK